MKNLPLNKGLVVKEQPNPTYEDCIATGTAVTCDDPSYLGRGAVVEFEQFQHKLCLVGWTVLRYDRIQKLIHSAHTILWT